MNKIIVGLGEILWDVFPNKKILGGAPANFAYHISQFGYDGYAVSAVGDDPLGREIISALNDKKLNYLIEKTAYPTGIVNITVDSRGVPEYEICEGVAWDNMPFTAKMKELANRASVTSFGSLAQRNSVSRESIRTFLAAMPADSLKIFDINLRQHFYDKSLIHESLELANVLKINDEEIIVVSKLFGLEDKTEEDVCRWLLNTYKLNILILTKGTEGSYAFTSTETSFQPTLKVDVADTVGAGDSFTAAFVASYLNGDSITDAHRLAVEVSAYVCTQYGAMPKLPDTYLR